MAWRTVGAEGVTKVVGRVFQWPLAGDPGLDCKPEEGEHRQAAVAHLPDSTKAPPLDCKRCDLMKTVLFCMRSAWQSQRHDNSSNLFTKLVATCKLLFN